MFRIAYLVEQDFKEKRGLANAVLSRIKYLKSISKNSIDVFVIQAYNPFFLKRKAKDRELVVDGVKMKIIYRFVSIIDYFLVIKMRKSPLLTKKIHKSKAVLFQRYDLISCHNLSCGEIALYAKDLYHIPYVMSWYGSDVHSTPYYSNYYSNLTAKVMEGADKNFFVCKDLQDKSNKISLINNKDILYIGIREGFNKLSNERRTNLRREFNVETKKVIAFVGGLVEVKNPLILPEIFEKLNENNPDRFAFWIIGSGKLMNQIKNKCKLFKLNVKLWGYVPDCDLPLMLNCVDVLVLPSFNEGLPLITLEALSCGANVVGSNVGGIPEAIGAENTFELDNSFVDEVAKRIIFMTDNTVNQSIPSIMSWEYTARHEDDVYGCILDKNSHN